MKTAAYILNEISNLEQSFQSVKPFVQEIVCVLDTRSEEYDKLKALCLKHTNKVYDWDWKDDSFASARNESLKHCTGDWIFIIDNDEILEAFEEPSEEFDYYPGVIINNVDGVDKKSPNIRLWKNYKGIKYENARHESVETSVRKMKLGVMNLRIRHFGYEGINVRTKILDLIERHFKQLEEEPDNFALKYHLAKAYWGLCDWENCRDWGMLALLTPINIEAKATTCMMLYLCYKNHGKEPIGLMWLELSIKMLPEQVASHYLFYDYYSRNHNIDKQTEYLNNIKKTYTTGTRLPNDIEIELETVETRLKELTNGIQT